MGVTAVAARAVKALTPRTGSRVVARGARVATPSGMYVDRRRTIRAPCDLAVEWKRGRKVTQARAKDINRDGLFVATTQVIELNQLIDLTVVFPTARVSVFGVTRFCGKSRLGHGLGIAIHAIDPEDRRRWDAYYRIAIEEMLRRLPEPVARMLRVVDR